MRVLITGIGGFIGQHLATCLAQAHHSVAGAFHRQSEGKEHPTCLAGLYQMSLDDEPPHIDFSAFDVVIHLAFDSHSRRSDTNYKGTVRIAEAARRCGVARQVFVSSHSARPDAISEYAQVKYRLERYFLDGGYEIVRPGLVLGNGGIVGRIISVLKVVPIIPLPSGGEGEVPFISIGALCEALQRILHHPGNREHNLFSRDYTSLRLLVQTLRNVVCRSRSAVLLPVPPYLMLHALQVAGILRLPIPVSVDNLKGFLTNQTRLHESTLDDLGVNSETLIEAVEIANLR